MAINHAINLETCSYTPLPKSRLIPEVTRLPDSWSHQTSKKQTRSAWMYRSRARQETKEWGVAYW